MKTILVAAAVSFMALPAFARSEFLGSGRFSRTGSAVSVYGPRCRQGEVMDGMRLIVRNQPAYVDQIAVRFDNGRVQRFAVRQNFPANSQTRWIDLQSNTCVNAVQVTGQSLNLLQKATAEIWGRVNYYGWPGGGNGGNGGWPGGGGHDDGHGGPGHDDGGGNGGWPGGGHDDGGHHGGHHGGGHDDGGDHHG